VCGRYPTARLSWAEIHAQLSGFLTDWAEPQEPLAARYNIAPTQDAPIVTAEGPGRARGLLARWDFVPFFHKGALEAKKWSSFNAKVETAAGSAAFRQAVAQRRCLVPNRGFFEWLREGKAKQPLWFAPTQGEVQFFAGLWDRWSGLHKGQPTAFTSFAILTCEPNSVVAPVHDRMPVLLLPEDRATWLFGAPQEALQRAGSYPSQLLRATMIGPAIGHVANDGPELLEPLA
jgi:putative SOS response-associated peptidase YedK